MLVVASRAARWESVLPRITAGRCWFLLLADVDRAATIAREAAVGLVILDGPVAFCEPLLRRYAEARAAQPFPPLVVVPDAGSEQLAILALRAGAADYLTGDVDDAAIDRLLATWIGVRPEPTADVPLTGGDVLVGGSGAMQALRVQIRRVAATDCNVLITGETGTGKELVAQLVHQNSARAARPLMCINCAAIPDSLLESELFGYERGAFTGAAVPSPGKLMAAHRGTVFFDEIGDMSPYAQAKILRAIEAKEVQRLGAARRYEADIRVLAATHHDLDDLASADTFRRDLYFRLNVGRLHLPPLRERKADIGSLVDRMVADFNRRLGRHVEAPDEETRCALMAYDWPGNVRELKNTIERVFITRESGRLSADDLPEKIRGPRPAARSRADAEARILRAALVSCSGNKSKAAEKLNWSRMTLYRKMARYQLHESSRGQARPDDDAPPGARGDDASRKTG